MSNESIDIEIHESGSRTVRRNFADIGSAAEQAARGVDVLKAALFGLSTATIIRQFITLADAFTTLQNKLKAVGIEGNVLTTVTSELFKVANDTRASVEATAQVYSRLALSSKEMGTSQQELLYITKSLNQALILSGATGHEAAAGLLQLSQAVASNRLGGDELRSVLEQLPVVADVIAKQLGVTRGELRKLGTEGKITAKVIFDAFKTARDELNEKFARTIPTIAQGFVVLHNSLLEYVGTMNQANGITAQFSKLLVIVSNNIKPIAEGLGIATAAAAVFFSANMISRVVKMGAALLTLLAANPILLFIAAIAAASAIIYTFGDDILIGVDKVTSLKDVFRSVGDQIIPILTSINENVEKLWDNFTVSSNSAISKFDFSFAAIATTTAREFDTIIGIISGTVAVIVSLSKTISEAFERTWDNIVILSIQTTTALSEGWSEFVYVINAAWDTIWKIASGVFVDIYKGIISWATKVAEIIGGWLPDGIKKFFGDVYDWVVKLFKSLVGWIVNIVNDIRAFFDKPVKEFGGNFKEGWDAGKSRRDQMIADAEKFGKDVGDIFKKGFNSSGSPVGDWLTKVLEEAKNISVTRKINEMLARQDPADLTKGGPDKTKPLPGKDNSKTLESLAKQILDLIKKIDPASAAMAEFEKEQLLLNKALAAGVINLTQYNALVALTGEHFRSTVDDAFKARKEFDGLISTMEQATNNPKLKNVGFDQEAAKRQISVKYPDLFFGTDQEIKNKLFMYEENVRRINELQARQLMTEQEANQARMMQAELLRQAIVNAAISSAQFRLNSGAGEWADAWLVALSKVTAGFTTFAAGATNVMGEFATAMTDGISNSIGRAIVYSEDLGAALYKVAQGALESLISGFIKLGLQWLINAAIGQTIAASSQAASVALAAATGTALATAYAPAAALASLASYGANAFPAQAAITTTMAAARLAAITGFMKGGFTGNMGSNQVAGIVHGQEYVFDAKSTKNLGVRTLDNLRRNSLRPPRGNPTSGATASTGIGELNIYIENHGAGKQFEIQQLNERDIRIIAKDEIRKNAGSVVASELKNPNSDVSKSFGRNTTAQRNR